MCTAPYASRILGADDTEFEGINQANHLTLGPTFCLVSDIGKRSLKDGVNLSLPRNSSLVTRLAPGHV